MNKCSIVIRCYNEEKHIGRLLAGIYQQNFSFAGNPEVIVVDSGSTDKTVEIANKYPVKFLTIPKEEFSFGRALNIGCQAATGDYLIFVSAHVYPVYQDWLEQIIAPFSNPDIALVYGKQRGNEATKYSEHQIFAKWFPEESNLNQIHPFCNNANAAVRRSLWQQLPYNEVLTGLEDLDWGKRAQNLGYKIAYAADAVIVHVHEETSARTFNRYRREAIALKQVLPEEKFHFWDFIRLFTTNTLSDLYHSIYDKTFFTHLKEIVIFRFMQFWGTYRGFSYHGQITSQLRQTFYYPKGLSRKPDAKVTPSKQPIDYSNTISSAKQSQMVEAASTKE